jgi:ABC-type bacteriocin/lantibiotic exporter with double-glycine peptidase domain
LTTQFATTCFLGLPARPDVDLMRALFAANLADFVSAQLSGLDTPVGDNGTSVSGGQQQQLGLARAILRASTLLLLDEATSALDPENERQILANLSAQGAAVFLVTSAHAHTFARRLFRLERGFLVEEHAPNMCNEEVVLHASHATAEPEELFPAATAGSEKVLGSQVIKIWATRERGP